MDNETYNNIKDFLTVPPIKIEINPVKLIFIYLIGNFIVKPLIDEFIVGPIKGKYFTKLKETGEN
jgi:hypothetical protein